MLSHFKPIRALRGAVRAAVSGRRGQSPVSAYAFHYERILGTSLELQVAATSAGAAQRAEEAVLAEVERLAEVLSGYSETSELTRWQRQRGVIVPVSPDLADVLEAAEAWRIRTGGAFNAAASSIVDLLHDGAESTRDDIARQVAMRERARAIRRTLWTVDRIRSVACCLTDVSFSLDAIAKGYIVDRAALSAQRVAGVTQVLVNIGGDLRHCGTRPITVGIANPAAPAENAPVIATVRLVNEALATSGGYRRGFQMDGAFASHIIDPRTGEPGRRVTSASVIARDCATADALSTAFSVLPPDESVALADSLPDVGCMMVEQDGTITTNANWRAHTAS